VSLASMVSLRRSARIVELVGLAGTADAAYGRPALLERQKPAVDAAKVKAVIDGAPRVGIIGPFIRAGCRRRQHRHQQEHCQHHNFRAHQVQAFLVVGPFGRTAASTNKRPRP
jgi:hypothetical protein